MKKLTLKQKVGASALILALSGSSAYASSALPSGTTADITATKADIVTAGQATVGITVLLFALKSLRKVL